MSARRSPARATTSVRRSKWWLRSPRPTARAARSRIRTVSPRWENAQKIVQTAIDNFGRIDMVVNNAGILRDRMFHYMSPEEWDAVIKVHLYGAFSVSRAAVTHFRKQESGCFVHITSTSGLIGSVGQANYGAAKLGIAGLSRNIAMECTL